MTREHKIQTKNSGFYETRNVAQFQYKRLEGSAICQELYWNVFFINDFKYFFTLNLSTWWYISSKTTNHPLYRNAYIKMILFILYLCFITIYYNHIYNLPVYRNGRQCECWHVDGRSLQNSLYLRSSLRRDDIQEKKLMLIYQRIFIWNLIKISLKATNNLPD